VGINFRTYQLLMVSDLFQRFHTSLLVLVYIYIYTSLLWVWDFLKTFIPVLILGSKADFWLVCSRYISDIEIESGRVFNWYDLKSLPGRYWYEAGITLKSLPGRYWFKAGIASGQYQSCQFFDARTSTTHSASEFIRHSETSAP
jgi:hypothetical protein